MTDLRTLDVSMKVRVRYQAPAFASDDDMEKAARVAVASALWTTFLPADDEAMGVTQVLAVGPVIG